MESFIFVGDYCLSNPFPNECITRIRNLSNKYVIRGNEERHLENLVGKDQRKWIDGQMQISYWCFRKISDENREYLLSLPTQIDIACNGVTIHVAHSSTEFIGDSEQKEWVSSKVAERYRNQFIRQATLRQDIHRSFG